MLFLGTYEYSMDERGRVPIPPRFRDAFLAGIILTQGAPDPCIRAYPVGGFEEQATLYTKDPITKRSGRMLRRSFFSGAYPAEVDRQGRVLIPPPLRRFANLASQVIVIGIGEGMEIWDGVRLEEARAREEADLERTMESE